MPPKPSFAAIPDVSLSAVAAAAGLELPSGIDGSRTIAGLAHIDSAGPHDLTIAEAEVAAADLAATCAAACLVSPSRAADLPPSTIALVTDDTGAALRRVATLFHPGGYAPELVFHEDGHHLRAQIHPDARLEPGVALDVGVVVGPRAQIGTGTRIGANTVVGADVSIGRNCHIGPQISLQNAMIGDRVVIHAGTHIGPGSRMADVRQPAPDVRAGRVIIQDDVTIGANAVLERGILSDTTIGEKAEVEPLACVRAGTSVPRAARYPAAGSSPRPA